MDWDAGSYHRVSEPQVEWGRRVLARLELAGGELVADIGCGTGRLTRELAGRLPAGRVVAIDRSSAMLAQAAIHLSGAGCQVRLVRASADALPFRDTFDVVFSTATFHWVLAHDTLFRGIFDVLRPGGRLHAQCGGGPNLARLRSRASALTRDPRFADSFGADWSEPWHYADAASTEDRLIAAGFARVVVSLEPAPISFANSTDFQTFADTVCLRPYLERLPLASRTAFSRALVEAAEADDPPLTLDYFRLNLAGEKPEKGALLPSQSPSQNA